MGGGGGGGPSRRRPVPPLPEEGRGGGGGGGSAGGGRPGRVDKCAEIDEFTDILSPKAEVLAKVKRGSVLTLTLSKGKVPIVAQTPDGETLGSVVPLVIDLLLDCMKKGREFVAEVISKAGGACKVRIIPKDR